MMMTTPILNPAFVRCVTKIQRRRLIMMIGIPILNPGFAGFGDI